MWYGGPEQTGGTTMYMDLSNLTSYKLTEKLRKTLDNERECIAESILFLHEIEERKIFLIFDKLIKN